MEFYTNIVLVIFTGFLAWATYKLAQHTKSLSDFTKQLVNIEEAQDRHGQQEKRRAEISRSLELFENFRKLTQTNL